MSDYIGVKKLCTLCMYSSVREGVITCTNKNSGFYGLRVNEVLCAPCIIPNKEDKEKIVDTVTFD